MDSLRSTIVSPAFWDYHLQSFCSTVGPQNNMFIYESYAVFKYAFFNIQLWDRKLKPVLHR